MRWLCGVVVNTKSKSFLALDCDETQTQRLGGTSRVSISSPDYWEGYIRMDVQCIICATSKKQICCGDSLENKGAAETTYQLYILWLDLKYLIKKKKVLFPKMQLFPLKLERNVPRKSRIYP